MLPPPQHSPRRLRGRIKSRGARCRDGGGRGQWGFLRGSAGAIRIPLVLAVLRQQLIGDISIGEIGAPFDALLHGLELGLVDDAHGGGDGRDSPERGGEVECCGDGDSGHHTRCGDERSAVNLGLVSRLM